MTSFRRRKFLVVVPFQLRFVAFRIVLMLIFTLCLWIFVFYPLQIEIIGDLQNASRGVPESNLPIPNLQVFIGIGVVFLLIGLMALFESHRIAGPIYRFEKKIRALLSGEYGEQVVLRKLDNFTHVAPLLNEISDKMARSARAEQFLAEALPTELKNVETLCRQGNTSEACTTLNALRESVQKILGEKA